MYDVSIVIPIYNVENYICECLESVMSQSTSCSIECLLVDDCGQDASMHNVNKLLSEYSGKISFRIICHDKNRGLSAARNSGIRAAKGKYLFFLDSDDIISIDCIGSLFERACEYPEAQIIVGDFQTFPQKDIHKLLSLQGKNFPVYSDDIQWIQSIFLSKFPITAWNKLIQRNFIINNGLFFKEGIIHEDNHWQAQAYHVVRALAVVDRITYWYRMREDSITTNKEANKKKLENLTIIYKEMFSKRIKWDKYWAYWIFNSLNSLKYSPIFSSEREAAMKSFKSLCKLIYNNKSVPYIIRWIFYYWGINHHRGQDRIVSMVFFRYWK